MSFGHHVRRDVVPNNFLNGHIPAFQFFEERHGIITVTAAKVEDLQRSLNFLEVWLDVINKIFDDQLSVEFLKVINFRVGSVKHFLVTPEKAYRVVCNPLH
jgi:hypothetical protein